MVIAAGQQTASNSRERTLVQHELQDEMSIPPHSSQAEEAVLGSVLKRGLAIADVIPFLKPHHCYESRHGYIYAAMAAPFDRAAAIDYHMIADELEHQGMYEQAGGLVYLSELSLSTPSAAHIEHYARIVLEHAVRRRYIDAGQQGSGAGLESSQGPGHRQATIGGARAWRIVRHAEPARGAASVSMD